MNEHLDDGSYDIPEDELLAIMGRNNDFSVDDQLETLPQQ